MNIEDLSIFGLYSQMENKVTAALLQVLEFGGSSNHLLKAILFMRASKKRTKEIINAKNKNNMKRSLHFYKWLVAVVVLICSTITMSAQTKVTSLSQLKAGSVIKIYPKDSDGTSHYGESKYALACSGDGQSLTSYEKAGSGDEWTLEDAGDGFCYLKNDKGCYWAYQRSSSFESLQCTMNKNSAVKISLTWDTKYSGVCFWNAKDGRGLNNLFEYNNRYNWWSDPDDYSGDANTCFDIAILSDGNGVAKNIVTSVSQLKAGSVINIYPKNSDGTSHYGESK